MSEYYKEIIMKKLNLYFGLTLFIGFLATGYYMAEYFKPEHMQNYVMRMQLRANHIYTFYCTAKCDFVQM